MLSFSLLGQVVLSLDGVPLSQFRSQKEAALLIYLAHTGQTHSRDFLADLLWESRSTKQSLSNLRTILSRLRKQVGDELLITQKTVSLTTENQQDVDSLRLVQTLTNLGPVDSDAAATALHTTLATYQGEFLAHFSLPDAPQFNAWATQTREQIRRQVIAAYDRLGQYRLKSGQVDDGIQVARRWLQVDALDETAHTLLIQLLLKAGRGREALTHYDDCAHLLRTELGIEPPAPLTALIKTIQPPPATPAYRASTVRHNLPPETDQFFGRQTVQQEIYIRLDQPWCRVVTLVGQGGVGKTRLATTIARSRLRQYPDGVWLVELADIDPDDDDVAEAIAVEIATVLDMRLTGSETPAQQLLNHLKYKQILLVLDNFEHLLGGIQLVQEMIQQCETVQLLVTSREALRLRAEWTVALNGLSYPPSDSDELPSEAVELFGARYAQQQHEPVAADDLLAVRTICRMVEGLPLAIELAAALTRHTSPRVVADRLRDGFDALTTSLRDVPERHRGLHVVFEMSWRTLTPALQQCLARLALFRGGFTQTAAQQITHAAADQITALGDKSLLTYQATTDRYTLHPIIRAYAAAHLPPTDPTPSQHAHYYLTLLAQHTEPLQKSAPQHSINVVEPDMDNVRLAWQTGLAEGKADLLFDALTSLSIYYQLRGLAHEAEAIMHTTVSTATAWGTAGLTLATHAGLERARFQNRLGQYRPAMQAVQTALKLAAQGGDRWAEGMGQVLWGESLWRLGEYDAAAAKLNHALTVAQAIDATLIIGWCHHHLGIINDIQSRYTIAHDHLQQACAAWQKTGNAQALNGSLNSIGLVCYHQGELKAAQDAWEKAQVICEQLGDHHRQSALVNNLSIIATEQGDYLGAQYYLQLGLELATTSGNLVGQGDIFINLGKNYHLQGELELARENLEQGLRIAELIGNRSSTAMAMIDLAENQKEQGNFERAQTLYSHALKIARENNLRYAECDALIGMAELLGTIRAKEAGQYGAEAVALAREIQNPRFLERARAIVNYLDVPTSTNK
ncbi:MAG: tetratricopeptide repeat protein [Chloroflexi bacterium]|nr:tetratricopeptide repeat protein [Chloroflexota bacterium]MBP8057408.1 tetratricopeptide repeat protein [Chloroflexota bacterium]